MTFKRIELYRGGSQPRKNAYWRIIKNKCPLLTICISAEADRYKSKQSTSVLQSILDYRERKFTFITTNISKEKWADHWDMRVSDRLRRNKAEDVGLWHMKSYNL